jgi:FkbM family methyltransferase
MYSQNDEEKFVCEYFQGRTGRFLDIGAYDGVKLSNTRKLLELGWSGVLVEPGAANFVALMQNCREFSDCTILIQAAVSDFPKLGRLWIDEYPDRNWSTTVSRSLMESGSVMKPSPMNVIVPCIEMADLMEFGPYDFVSLDAEWQDWTIVTTAPAALWRKFELICVEAYKDFDRQNMLELFTGYGFSLVHSTTENIIVKRK